MTRIALTSLLCLTLASLGCAHGAPLPEPRDCAAIGAGFGAVGGGAGAAGYLEDGGAAGAAGIGIGSVVVGAALGYGVCALFARRAPEPVVVKVPTPRPRVVPRSLDVVPEPKPVPRSGPMRVPATDVCTAPVVLEGVNFAVNSARIDDASATVLDEVVRDLSNCRAVRLRIEAHTDSAGSEEANQYLSELRARAVLSFLRDRGIEDERIQAIGYGEMRPIGDNLTPEGRSKNRRVEIVPARIEDPRDR